MQPRVIIKLYIAEDVVSLVATGFFFFEGELLLVNYDIIET